MGSEGLWEPHGLVISTRTGTRIGKRNMITTFKRLLARAGLPETIRFHDLRLSCASFMIAQGVHHRVIMQVLGHAQFSTTMNIYAHVLDDVQGKATGGIDEMWG
jgi:site-specific recombinase XerD